VLQIVKVFTLLTMFWWWWS